MKSEFPLCLARGLVGAAMGGVIGFWIFYFLFENQGFYQPIIPAALVGVGFELAARKKHIAFGFLCAALGLMACLISEWRAFRPFNSFSEFLWKFKDEGTESFLLIGLGVLIAFWFGWGRDPKQIPMEQGQAKETASTNNEPAKPPFD